MTGVNWRIKNITGLKFGRLTVLRPTKQRDRYRCVIWVCQCECGRRTKTSGFALKHGLKRSCGCLRRERFIAMIKKHGHACRGKLTPTYISWRCMKDRCFNSNAANFHLYGGRGITIEAAWHPFKDFLADILADPKLGVCGKRNGRRRKTLDRLDPTSNYGPDKCRWATPVEQARNKRNSKNSISISTAIPNSDNGVVFFGPALIDLWIRALGCSGDKHVNIKDVKL